MMPEPTRPIARPHLGLPAALHRLAVAVVLGLATLSSPAAADPAARPNVIVILTDDQGTVDAGCWGTGDIETPGIDALAATGIRLTQFYAAAPVCSPSRAGLLTGRYPVRAGVPGNVSSTAGDPGMPASQVTIAEVFSKAGYATAHVGKWHLGYSTETMPNAQGFDFSFGHMGGCIDNFSHFFYWHGPNRHDLHLNGEEVHRDGGFFPDLMVDEAARFIDAHVDRPFLIYFALNAPHYPYQGSSAWLDHYRRKGVPHPRDLYNAFVSTLDERIGRLVAHVESRGLRERTIIVFQSDHGHSTEERAHFGGGSAGPYRGAKFSLFEGGIRVPAIVSWPATLPAGRTTNAIAHSCDWLPTLASLAGVDVGDLDLDGKDVSPMLRDENARSPHDVVHWQTGGQWAVRKGPWKLIGNANDTSRPPQKSYPRPEPLFLSNLELDPTESRNLAGENPAMVKELEALHQAWSETLNAEH